jgi:hypothetical protein
VGCSEAQQEPTGTGANAVAVAPRAGDEALVGVYVGEIQGFSDENDTEFFLDAKGGLGGRYIQRLKGDEYPGDLSNLVFDGATGELTGNWTDEFGTGTISFVFTATSTPGRSAPGI